MSVKDKKWEQYQIAKREGMTAVSSFATRNNSLYAAYRVFEMLDAGIIKLDDENVTQSLRTAYNRFKTGLCYDYLIDGVPRSGTLEARVSDLTTGQADAAMEISMKYQGSNKITKSALTYAEGLNL